MRVPTALLCLALAVPALLAAEDPGASPKLLDGMGAHHRDVGTKPEAQRFFDQGLVLAYGFNHAAAERSFREAARLDPACAMCSWGAALVLGPHINAAMVESAVSPAWEASQEAKRLAKGAQPVDRALIEALTKRYSPMPGADRAALDRAYADAMRDVASRFPDDADVQTLAAEALMDLHPWDLWEKNGTAKPWTPEIVTLLERAISLAPQHPGANHFYIHAVEASKEPQRAMASADRLRDLVPGAGHLVHMPAHVFIRTGRYWDAVLANRRAIDADRKSEQASCHGSPYALSYVPHNVHFLWAAAAFAGAGGVAVDSAKLTADGVDETKLREPGLGVLQQYWVTPLYAWVRFGHWDEILAMPEPEADLVYPRSVWRWARGVAHVRQIELDEAAKDLAALQTLAADPGLRKVTIFDLYDTSGLVAVAREHLAGELAFARGERDAGVAHVRQAVALEDRLPYDEPPPWPLPMRHVLGAMLLEMGRPAEAEVVYRADLEIYPENGWALRGLSRALAEQGRPADAAAAESRFQRAWAKGDFELDSSRL
ncbi:MAG TPA: tetratricopeptide repeat protein [Myxococcota bacterium]|nr:tetratricopeptide repeat protein [Myxococcota bacterium]